MSKILTKRLFAGILVVVLAAVCAVILLTACSPSDEFEIKFRDDVNTERLEFVTGSYDRNKPTLVYFHGLVSGSDRVSLVRPTEYDAVLDEGESNNPVTLKSNLADYWREQSWNVAIFHYEEEAKGGKADFYANLFGSKSLLEEFVNVYRLYFAAQAADFDKNIDLGTAKGLTELRFAGDGVGASFASYAAEALSRLVRNGRLSEFYLPWRLTLLNPDLDNAEYVSSVSSVGAGASPLEGVTRAVRNASVMGNVVSELIESDINYETSYNSPYTEENKATYATLLNWVACLEINETFSTTAGWSPELKDSVAKVWYLATVGGSDYSSTGGSSVPSTMKNLLPFINNPKENYSNSVSFSISAWTPTTAIRGLRGLRFRSADINSSETPKYKERVITKFRLELFESSFPTQTKPRVGGYLFIDKNGDVYLNDGRLAFMREGLTVRMRYTVSGREETTVTTTTQHDGYYMFEIPEEAYQVAVYLDFEIPDYRFLFANKDTSGKTNDELCSMAAVNGTMQFVSSSWRDQYNVIKNCGYRYSDKAEA